MKNIRNFSIIAHINHGKSTLADRIIEICNNISLCVENSQILDTLEIEKKRGITIKAQNITLKYKFNKKIYILNLIDTPGHADFYYEVKRSLSVCEGVLLLIDCSKGIQSQTLSNYYIALKLKIKIIIVLNKIDIPNINILKVKKEIKEKLNIKDKDILLCSSKTGYGVKKILKKIILEIPSPKGDCNLPLQALIIDSFFNNYYGIILLVRIFNGKVSLKDKIFFISTKAVYIVNSLNIFNLKMINKNSLKTGEIGYILGGIKNIKDIKIGDTITLFSNRTNNILIKFNKIKSKIFISFFPLDLKKYHLLNNALKKLKLNDSSLNFIKEESSILGLGFRCGFLGILHMEITKERLENEFNIKIIITPPNVIYKICTKENKIIKIENIKKMPEFFNIKYIKEPIVTLKIYSPKKFLGLIIELCNKKRGMLINIIYKKNKNKIVYEIPFSEIIFDFFNLLKSITQGYANMNYKFKKYIISDIVKIDVLFNDKKIDILSFLVHKNNSYNKAYQIISKIKKFLPRQLFDINIKVILKNKVIFRKNIKSIKKNVISKCYGGDITRKKKLLNKQKKGKKKLKKYGLIKIPQKIFSSIMNI